MTWITSKLYLNIEQKIDYIINVHSTGDREGLFSCYHDKDPHLHEYVCDLKSYRVVAPDLLTTAHSCMSMHCKDMKKCAFNCIKIFYKTIS